MESRDSNLMLSDRLHSNKMVRIVGLLKEPNYRHYLKSCFYKLIGWTDGADIETRRALAHFDYLNKLFLVSLCGGQKQEYGKPITRKVWISNWIIRIVILSTFIRTNLFLYFHGCHQMDLYLANPLSNATRSKKIVFFIYFDVTLLILSGLREYCHYIERSSVLVPFRIFFNIRKHGVKWKPLRLNMRHSKLFNKACYFIITNGTRISVFICFYSALLIFGIRLYFSNYSTLLHIIFILLFTAFEITMMVTCITLLVSLGVYLMALIAFFNAQADTIIDEIQDSLRKVPLSPQELRQVNGKVIQFLNNIEKTYLRLNYLYLYLEVFIAFEVDLVLFLVLFTDSLLSTSFIASIFVVGSLLIHAFLVIGNYWASRYHTKTLSIHGYYTGLILNTKTICSAQFKALEVQDRINGNKTGIAIGDFCLITPAFSLIFILENINFIMLLAVNVKTMI
uniref:Odorant receptor n=1 Tax=Tetranychus urticae TaxID=32264 RepID=T1L2I2_TETUR